jgi:hypothetical protein
MLPNDPVVPTTNDRGVTNEPLSEINTNYLVLPNYMVRAPNPDKPELKIED